MCTSANFCAKNPSLCICNRPAEPIQPIPFVGYSQQAPDDDELTPGELRAMKVFWVAYACAVVYLGYEVWGVVGGHVVTALANMARSVG